MSRYSLLTGSLCLMAGLCFGDVVLTPYVSLAGYATTGEVAAVQADLDATRSIATNALAIASTALQPDATNDLALAVAAVRAEVEAAASPKLTMVPTGTTVISTDTTVQVVPTRGIYNLQVRGDSDISFDLSSIDITHNVARWETWIKVFAPGMTVGLPSTNAVQYLETPDLTTTTTNELLQISWQAWMDGTNLMMQGHMYNRNTQMPPPIAESPAPWFVFDAGTKTITRYNYVEGRENVVIPLEIGGVAVEVLGDLAFSPNAAGYPITSVVAESSVLSIGANAFYFCTSLTSATLPAATDIGDSAFIGCGSLTSATLPAATSIGAYAFAGTSLTSAALPAATDIGNHAFYYCGSLTSATLPAATSIGAYAFAGTSLTSATLTAATDIGDYAFNDCASLTSATLPAATGIGNNAFNYCPSLTSATLPAATSIGDYAFNDCTSLTSVTLPAATSIGNNAFDSCTSLTSIYFGVNAPTAGTGMFSEVPTNQVTIYYPSGAPAWSGVATWGGMQTAPYTP